MATLDKIDPRVARIRFTILMVSLVAFLFLSAVLPADTALQRYLSRALLTLMLFASIYVCADSRRLFLSALALALPALALGWASNFAPSPGVLLAQQLLTAAFLTLTVVIVLVDVMRAPKVTLDTIAGGISCYLLLGVVWMLLFAAVYTVNPAAFGFPGDSAAAVQVAAASGDLRIFIYYSFVTLTTLGYGDIVPMSDAARALASLEAIVGQMYVAILVARLVGLQIADQSEPG